MWRHPMPIRRADPHAPADLTIAYDALPCPDLADRLARVYSWATEAARVVDAQLPVAPEPNDDAAA